MIHALIKLVAKGCEGNETAAKIVIVLAVVAIAAIVIRFLVTGSLTI